MAAPILESDAQRVALLHRYGLLDTAAETAYDDLAALAARICQAPIGLITLIDTDRQWFKARFGFDLPETSRDLSFCAHTILQDDAFVVPDACRDPRFEENPLVTGEPGIRFYAGLPLKAPGGLVLGALCVIDRVPRTLAPEHHDALLLVARQIQDLFEERRRSRNISSALADSEDLFRLLTQTTSDSVVVLDGSNLIQFANQAVAGMFGYAPDALTGQPISVLQPERLRERHRQGMARYLTTGDRRLDWGATETIGLHRDGREFPIGIKFSHLEGPHGGLFAGFIHDLTRRKAAEAAMQESEGRFRTLVESSGVGIWQLDRDRVTVYANTALLAMIEVESLADLRGRTFTDFLTRESRAVADREHRRRALGESSTYEVELVGDRGTQRQVLVSGAPLQDAAGGWVGTIGTLVDVSDLRRVEQQVGYLTQFDALTGLPNRALFGDRLAQALIRAERAQALVAVLLLNIDRFREINDGLGHHVGDAVLRAVATRVREMLYKVDTVARLGADEFAVVIEGLHDRTEARVVADRLASEFQAPFQATGQEVFLQASIGVALYPQDARDGAVLLRVADLALNDAKRIGGAVRFGEPGADTGPTRRRRLDTLLRHALERNELFVEYEPMVDARDGHVVGLEALLRWQSAELGRLPPSEFVSLAEANGLIVPIGRFVLETACADLGRLHAAGHTGLIVSVNVSPRQLREPDLARVVGDTIARLAPGSVELELTEGMLMDVSSRGALSELRAAGARISIDDFGTGYSSLAYLKGFPIDKLKIDRTFVRDIGASGNEAIVHTIITLARHLGLVSIAEGVEQAHQLTFLAGAGCDQCQGFLFSRSLAATDIPEMLAALRARSNGSV
jgi:diguanylate cyclase (GGDEF)-like protein/PAS domain S-box-containing protein